MYKLVYMYVKEVRNDLNKNLYIILCILSKVFEKNMYDRLLKFLEKLKIIYKTNLDFENFTLHIWL